MSTSVARFQAALSERYVIDRKIGAGGMGTVYLARDVKHGRQVAIKVIPAETLSAAGRRHFHREIRLTARLQHPHILPLLDSGEAAGCPYYVMPYVRDGSLRELLDRTGKLSLRQAMPILDAVSGALEYAHENQVIHCDIKPENILMSGRHAILTDFGISRAQHSDDLSWRAAVDRSVGTAAYVSPEMAFGDEQVDARADIFSLACVAFEMLTGRPPFEADSEIATVAQRMVGGAIDMRSLDGLPRGVALALHKALSADERRRFATVHRFWAALERGAGTPRAGISLVPRFFRQVRVTARWMRRRSRGSRQKLVEHTLESLEGARYSGSTNPALTS